MTAAVEQIHVVPHEPIARPSTGAPTVTHHHRPLTAPPSIARLITASVILGAPSAGAIWGSAAGLVHIATEDQVAAPGTLPFCLDVLALGVVVVAMLFPAVASRWTWKATPWLCYLFSGTLQVAEASNLGPRAWGTHAAGLVAAAVGSHFILNLWETRAVAATRSDAEEHRHGDVDRRPVPATPAAPQLAAAEPTVAMATVTPVRRPVAARRPSRSTTTTTPNPEVVEKVSAALTEMAVTAHETNRENLLKHMRQSGPAPHAREVGRALKSLRGETS